MRGGTTQDNGSAFNSGRGVLRAAPRTAVVGGRNNSTARRCMLLLLLFGARWQASG